MQSRPERARSTDVPVKSTDPRLTYRRYGLHVCISPEKETFVSASRLSREGGKRALAPCPPFFPQGGRAGGLMGAAGTVLGLIRSQVWSLLTGAVVSWYTWPAHARGGGPEEGMALFFLFALHCGLTQGLLHRTSPQGMGAGRVYRAHA